MEAAKTIREYVLGDMLARYVTDGPQGQVGLLLLPAVCRSQTKGCGNPSALSEGGVQKNACVDSLVQIKIAGDIYNEAYAMGSSMRNSETVRRLSFRQQDATEQGGRTEIATVLEDDRGYRVTHHLIWKQGARYVRIYCEFENHSEKNAPLEMFESFSLGGITPYAGGDGHERLWVYRARSVWSQEGRLEKLPAEDLQLEPAWEPHAVRCEKFGQTGSMPVNKFFPFVAVEDAASSVFWGAQIAHPASWQIELYRKDDALCVSGGLADRDFGHWMKDVAPGERFRTPEAIVSAAHTDSVDVFTARLTEAAWEGIENAPASERSLPIVFNEYCTTWGNPSHDNISDIVDKIKGRGFGYFVIDCGWYKEKDVPWDSSMGDYEVSKELFPDGLEKTVQKIKDAGMIPGIWFEMETVGSAAKAYRLEEHLLCKDGAALTSYFRRFWDMRDPWVERYLTKKVIGTLKQYGFGYMKLDYNETIGIGCDGAESLGEGLRQNMEGTKRLIEKIKREIPGIVIENCSSGGHRLEPGFMAQTSMASFSDAHECEEIPVIAANLHRLIHPAQSQIWAVVRTDDSAKRVAYSVISTFLGRMCISGDVTGLSEAQWQIIDRGMEFYRSIVPVILKGQSYRFGPKIRSVRHPKGWQALVRIGEAGGAFAVIHLFDGELPDKITVELPAEKSYTVEEVFSDTAEAVSLEDNRLSYVPLENRKAVALRLRYGIKA